MRGWICDVCGETIDSAKDGWVEWILFKDNDGEWKRRGIRLVHHRPASPRSGGCQYEEQALFRQNGSLVSDSSLERFACPDGLMKLLMWMKSGEMPVDDVIEIAKRIHIPGYEYARRHMESAIAEGVVQPNLPEGFYSQDQIEGALEFARRASGTRLNRGHVDLEVAPDSTRVRQDEFFDR